MTFVNVLTREFMMIAIEFGLRLFQFWTLADDTDAEFSLFMQDVSCRIQGQNRVLILKKNKKKKLVFKSTPDIRLLLSQIQIVLITLKKNWAVITSQVFRLNISKDGLIVMVFILSTPP